MPPPSEPPRDFTNVRLTLERAISHFVPSGMDLSVDDLVQRALVKLLRGPCEDVVDLPASYLWQVGRSVTIDELRRRQRQPRLESFRSLDHVIDGSPSADPEAGLRAEEIRQRLARCLERLRAPRRRAVSLYLDGQGVAQIAHRLGWTRKKAENNIYRGLADLRRHLLDEHIPP